AFALSLVGVTGCHAPAASLEPALSLGAEELDHATAQFKRGCDGGDPHACLQLGLAYAHGRGVRRNFGKAAAMYERACEGGVADGCSNLGGLYARGQGVR